MTEEKREGGRGSRRANKSEQVSEAEREKTRLVVRESVMEAQIEKKRGGAEILPSIRL